MSTTIHRFVVPPESMLDTDGSADNTAWRHALVLLIEQHGWLEGRWRRHLEQPQHVILLARWETEQDAMRFLAHAYSRFIDTAPPALTQAPASPELTDLDLEWAWPANWHVAGMTTIYRNTFCQSAADAEQIAHSARFYLQSLDEGPDSGVDRDYLGSGCGWARDAATGQHRALYVAISWESLESEAIYESTLLDNGSKTHITAMFHNPVLSKADPGGERFHVPWIDVNAARLREWRDSQATEPS